MKTALSSLSSSLRIRKLTIVSHVVAASILLASGCGQIGGAQYSPAMTPEDEGGASPEFAAQVDAQDKMTPEAEEVGPAELQGEVDSGAPAEELGLLSQDDVGASKPIVDETRPAQSAQRPEKKASLKTGSRLARSGSGSAEKSKRRASSSGRKPIKLAGGDNPLSDDESLGGVGPGTVRAKPKAEHPTKDLVPATEATGENYAFVEEQAFVNVADDPRSTFSVDVDTAAYANVRRFIRDGQMPPPDAVRIEEMINYFRYNDASKNLKLSPTQPVGLVAEVGQAPWNHEHKLVRLTVDSYEPPQGHRPATNLVFLIDVSGSMNESDKLPLLKRAFSVLTNQLNADDHVSIVVYAGASGVVLPPTSGNDRGKIMAALDELSAGGSTAGSQGIELAYAMAKQNFQRGQVNRVVLATDGDFNVGMTSQGALTRLIEEKRESGIELSVLGFGRGNLQDATMEMLADKGNGNYAYIDGIDEAKKVLGRELSATLMTVAKDVKLQIEFNPSKVAAYRLIGYDNRKLAHADFNNDRKDAGEIGAGHTVTALYEIIPAQPGASVDGTDALRYQSGRATVPAATSDELMNVKIRYKLPRAQTSSLASFPIQDQVRSFDETSQDFRFATAVAGFGLVLKRSPHAGTATLRDVSRWARGSAGNIVERREFLEIVQRAGHIGQPANAMLAR